MGLHFLCGGVLSIRVPHKIILFGEIGRAFSDSCGLIWVFVKGIILNFLMLTRLFLFYCMELVPWIRTVQGEAFHRHGEFFLKQLDFLEIDNFCYCGMKVASMGQTRLFFVIMELGFLLCSSSPILSISPTHIAHELLRPLLHHIKLCKFYRYCQFYIKSLFEPPLSN